MNIFNMVDILRNGIDERVKKFDSSSFYLCIFPFRSDLPLISCCFLNVALRQFLHLLSFLSLTTCLIVWCRMFTCHGE